MPWLSIIGEIGQWAGLVASVGGVVCELVTHADAGYIVITIAAVLYAGATKVKYYSGRAKRHDISRFPFK